MMSWSAGDGSDHENAESLVVLALARIVEVDNSNKEGDKIGDVVDTNELHPYAWWWCNIR